MPKAIRHTNGFEKLSPKQPEAVKQLLTQSEARALIEDLSRKPFMDMLSIMIGNHPTPQAILDFANRNPDRWSQAVSVFSKLSGYNEELNLNVSLMAQVKVLSDMDLEHALKDLNHQVGDSLLIEQVPAKEYTKPKAIPAPRKARSV